MEIQPPKKSLLKAMWKILLIDGDEDDFILIRDLLREARGRRIELYWASTYEMGRTKLAEDRYDAVFVDNDLGAQTGIALIRDLNERGFTVPLILFTGRGSYEEDLEAMRAGATLYTSKNELNALSLERFIRYAIERKQAETLLKESEEKFAVAFRASPAAQIITRQSDGVIFDVNESYEKLLGYSRAELIGHTTNELNIYLNIQDRDRVLGIMEQEGHVYNFEVTCRSKTGSLVYILGSVETIQIGSKDYILSTLIDITERKQAEAALEASERQSRELIQYAPTAIYEINFQTRRFTTVNDAMVVMTGYSREELLQMSAYDLVDEQSIALLEERMRQWQIGQPPTKNAEYRIKAKDGRFIDAVIDITIHLSEEGRPLSATVIAHDITERKRTEQALRASEEKFRTLFENSPEAVFLTHPDGSVEAANPAACAMFGWSEEEIRRLGRSGLLDLDDPRLTAALEERKRAGSFQAREYTGIRKGGEQFPVEVDSVILEGEPKRSFVILRDITVRKQAEAALRESEAILRESEERERNRAQELAAILDAVPAYIFITHDPDSRTMEANRATQELLRSKPGDNISKTAPEPEIPRQFRAMRDGKEIPNEELPVQLAAGKCIHVEDYEFDVVFEDGSSKRLMGNAAPLCDEHGSPAGAVGAFIDITELRRIEQETSERVALVEVQRRLLEHREMERSQIARDLHDGPIQSLGGLSFSLQMLQSAVENQEAQAMIEKTKQDVRDLVGELRGVCNELRPPLLERFGFRKAVQAHLDGFQKRHPEIKLDLDITEDPNRLPKNIATALFRIYQEALNNVVRHSEATEISIHFAFDPQPLRLEIQDNGKGFQDKMDWVELVRQGHFGLVGMKERAEAIGGEFKVQSFPGKGTVIQVTAPITD